MKGNFNNSFAVGLFSGFFIRHASTNSLNNFVYLEEDKVGGGFFGIKNKTFIGCIVELGGSPKNADTFIQVLLIYISFH